MTALASYSTGTVSVASGGTTVTGVGAIWSDANARPGDILQIGNFQSVITDKTDTTHLVIPPWGGGAQVGVAYKIWQVSPQRFAGAEAMATVNKLVAALDAREIPIVVGDDETEPDPSLGEESQTAIQPTTGKVWVMTGGVWVFLGIYKAFRPRGAYDNAATYYYGDVQTTSGSSYIYINETPSAGHGAPNATYWELLAAKGDPGSTGATGAGYGGTSATSRTIGTGSQAFATQAGLAYQNGARVRATSNSDTTKWMEGVATYSGTALTIAVDNINGSGTFADWNFNIAGQVGTAVGALLAANNLADVADIAAAFRNLGGFDLSTVVNLTAASTLTASAFGKLHFITGTAAFATTLPTPVGNAGKLIGFIVGAVASASKLFTLTTPAGAIGRSGSSIVMWANESVLLRSNGSDWEVLQSKQIPFVGSLSTTTDGAISATFTACQLTTPSGDRTGLNLAYDATNKTFKAPRTSSYQFNGYAYQTQTGGTSTNQMQLVVSGGALGGVYSWTGSVNAGTIYGSALFSVNAGQNVLMLGRGDGSSPKFAASLVPAYLDYAEVCPSW